VRLCYYLPYFLNSGLIMMDSDSDNENNEVNFDLREQTRVLPSRLRISKPPSTKISQN